MSDNATTIPSAPRGTTYTAVPAVGGVVEDKYKYKYIIAFTVTMAAMLELIDTSIVNVAIPHMMGNLGATLDEIAWVSTSYIIANVIVIPMSGWLSAYFGRKRYFTGSILLFVAASFFCGAATSLGGLIFWRVIQGIGGGALLSTAQATLFEAFPPKEVGIGQAMFGVGVMVGPTLGPTLGGWIVDNLNWPWIFYINVPLGLFAAFMVFTYVKDSKYQEKASTIDGTGILLLALCVGSLQWMLERGERYDWWDSRFVTMLGVTSVVSFILLIWRELTIDEPVIDLRVLKNRQLAGGVMIAAFLGFALYGSVFVLPVFLQGLHGMTANQTGMIILPGALASAVTMAVVGRNSARLDARITVPIGASMFLYSMWLLSRLTFDSGAGDLFWPLVLRGVGLGLIFVPLTGATMAELTAESARAGHRHVQPHAPARRLAGHRDQGHAALALHGAVARAARRACGDWRPDYAGAGGWHHPRVDRQGNERAVGQAAGADDHRPAAAGAGERARVLEAVPAERTRVDGGAAAAAAVPLREVERTRAGGALAVRGVDLDLCRAVPAVLHVHQPRLAAHLAVLHVLLILPAAGVERDLVRFAAVGTIHDGFRFGSSIAKREFLVDLFLGPVLVLDIRHLVKLALRARVRVFGRPPKQKHSRPRKWTTGWTQ